MADLVFEKSRISAVSLGSHQQRHEATQLRGTRPGVPEDLCSSLPIDCFFSSGGYRSLPFSKSSVVNVLGEVIRIHNNLASDHIINEGIE